MLKIIGIIIFILIVLSFFKPSFREYLNENIQVIFFKEAKERIKEKELIGSTEVYNPRIEEIQMILKKAGFYDGYIDGLIGITTRKALKEFQKSKGLKPSGVIDRETYSALLKEREEQISKKLEQPPVSLVLKETPLVDKSEEEILKIAGPQKEKSISSKDKIRQIQLALKKAGFDPGPIDGKLGPKTRQAIKAFQKKNNLKADGVVGKNTWEKLKIYLE